MIRNIPRSLIVGAAVVALVATFLAGAGPAQADDHLFPLQRNAGAGVVTGSVAYTNGTAIPPAMSGCASTTFDVTAEASGFIINTVLSGHVGSFQVTGTGASECDAALASAGTLDLSATGVGPTFSRIDCPSLTGAYTRVGTHVRATLAGVCFLNSFPTNQSLLVEAEWAPTAGDGVVTPVTAASFAGAFASLPA